MKKEKADSMGIYVHIPFCIQKCRYCDFLSFTGREEQQEEYIRALVGEIRAWGKVYGIRGRNDRVSTVYFGGGTPSVLAPIYIEEIMKELKENFTVEEQAEVTIECNPGTVDAAKFSSYFNVGINRISMGLQSTCDAELKTLGRIHSYQDFLQCYREAREAGFQNISIDVMSALPGQTKQSYLRTLQQVTDLRPEHISAYSLIIEEGTLFYELNKKGQLLLPDEDSEREMYYETKDFLEKQGYFRYEISNYAKPGYESRHNSSYWTGRNYLGFGLGASSLFDCVRFKNPDSMELYLQRTYGDSLLSGYEEVEKLTIREQMEEFMFLGLRMTSGISTEEFETRYNERFEAVYGAVCLKLQKEGLISWQGNRIRLTEKGIDVSNLVFSEFI